MKPSSKTTSATCLIFSLMVSFLCFASPGKSDSEKNTNLPDISVFLTKPSDRFLVDIKEISRGHPFLGVDSPHPHAGAHVHFDNTKNRWPRGKDEPSNYPAIYAVADGIVTRIDTRFPLISHDRYGLDLTFAQDAKGRKIRFCYSIEPMIPEPSEGFYKKFLLVREGQRVRNGDVIAYQYTPPSSGDGCHIHFHLSMDGRRNFLAPAIFTPEVVKAFHQQCQGFKGSNDGKAILVQSPSRPMGSLCDVPKSGYFASSPQPELYHQDISHLDCTRLQTKP
jgi:hypothetical protein